MKNVLDKEGNIIGKFDGRFIYSITDNSILYWIDDGDVYAKEIYDDIGLENFNKNQYGRIASFKDGKGIIENHVIFIIE
jgi:hypothetical protein